VKVHPESPALLPDDVARLKFIADLKRHLYFELGPRNRADYQTHAAAAAGPQPPEADAVTREEIRRIMERRPFFQLWSSLVRAAQDRMWEYVAQVVDRDIAHLSSRYRALQLASPDDSGTDVGAFPDYVTGADVHRMPGGYHVEREADDLRAGALYDLGGAVYQLGLGNVSGTMLNDTRGQTVVAHLRHHYPSFKPGRILDMGCSVGHNTVPIHREFPGAQLHAIDVGGPMVRYARLRAAGLGAHITFSRQNAECTNFEDRSFDLVVSQILLHETSPQATRRIFAESFRVLRDGGVAVHLEVPVRYEHCDAYEQFFRSWEHYYNNEPNIEGVASMDLHALAEESGFSSVQSGYQRIPLPTDATADLSPQPISGRGSWYIISGRRT
jgi:ubiquinone/menaquinone biosynthesis C-methylase UbiE